MLHDLVTLVSQKKTLNVLGLVFDEALESTTLEVELGSFLRFLVGDVDLFSVSEEEARTSRSCVDSCVIRNESERGVCH